MISIDVLFFAQFSPPLPHWWPEKSHQYSSPPSSFSLHVFCYSLVWTDCFISIFLFLWHYCFHDLPKSEARLSIIFQLILSFLLKPPKPWFTPAYFLYLSTSLVLTNFCFSAVHFTPCHVAKRHTLIIYCNVTE